MYTGKCSPLFCFLPYSSLISIFRMSKLALFQNGKFYHSWDNLLSIIFNFLRAKIKFARVITVLNSVNFLLQERGIKLMPQLKMSNRNANSFVHFN